MKKLEKKFRKHRYTIESFDCSCGCPCPCNYCAATYVAQRNADNNRIDNAADNAIMAS